MKKNHNQKCCVLGETPSGLCVLCPPTQGSSFLATLGWRTQSRRDCNTLKLKRWAIFKHPFGMGTLQWFRLLIPTFLFFGLAAALFAQQPANEEGRSRFRAVDIFIDSKSAPLAAWQIEFAAANGAAKIVGIEGGETEPFRNPPFYDPKAIQHERVIIASFSTEGAAKLPVGKTRVATIHLQIIGSAELQFDLKLQVAGDSQGNKIPAEATLEERKAK